MAVDKDGNEIVEENFELTDEALKAITEKVKSEMADASKEDIDKAVAEAVKAQVEEATKDILDQHLKNVEEIEKKAIQKHVDKQVADDPIAKGIADGKFTDEIAQMSPAMRFYRQARALDPETGDSEELKALNRFALASQIKARKELMKDKGQEAVAKTGYANEATAADGSVLIPDAEFVTTVFDNLPSYGVAFQYADVRQTDRTSVRVLSLDSGLSFYSTAEAGVKTGAKLAFAKNEVSLQKYAVIVPATDELTDDAAVDYWNLVTRELTRAYAKKADEIVFTDEATGSASAGTQKGGLINLTGVVTENVSGAGTTISWSDLLDLEAKLEDDIDTSNYKWFMRKETWYRLVETKGTTNDHYIAGSLNTATGWVGNINQPTTPWGTPVVFTRVLATSNSVSANDGFAVYGDLSNTMLYNKRGMALKMLTEATVVDSEGSNLNLATQDASAMRAVIRMLHVCPKACRPKFGILGTGTVS